MDDKSCKCTSYQAHIVSDHCQYKPKEPITKEQFLKYKNEQKKTKLLEFRGD